MSEWYCEEYKKFGKFEQQDKFEVSWLFGIVLVSPWDDLRF